MKATKSYKASITVHMDTKITYSEDAVAHMEDLESHIEAATVRAEAVRSYAG